MVTFSLFLFFSFFAPGFSFFLVYGVVAMVGDGRSEWPQSGHFHFLLSFFFVFPLFFIIPTFFYLPIFSMRQWSACIMHVH
ncbi:hypothetical protein BDY21DRAFT_353170 [Lineolata rhizophorae]|uniref:Uncharacterized protein n=1 Tax=Lineolata rhizophorae TaxID=578093 RepID=A0A6A6NRV8_9PEZI|nr:hypothetical protein BDY21DRAFT_353170 [Lineolata rhizophorae]